MGDLERDDLLRAIVDLILRAKPEDRRRLAVLLNEPEGRNRSVQHSAYDWFAILKERLG